MIQKAQAATRQLAKRQLTWLRSWSDIQLESDKRTLLDLILKEMSLRLNMISR